MNRRQGHKKAPPELTGLLAVRAISGAACLERHRTKVAAGTAPANNAFSYIPGTFFPLH
jgi:hypothetical protein